MNDPTADKDILILLGKIDGQLSSFMAAFASRNAEDDKKHERTDARLTKLESAMWIALGAAMASGGTAGAIAGVIFR